MSGRESFTTGPRVRAADSVEIATYHFGGDGPPLMLAHATGFHGRCWLPLARVLTDRFSVWAIDHRGHGDSGKDPRGRYDDWSVFVDDLLLVLDELGGTGWRAIGHSMGGAVLLLAEARRPGTFTGMCCYETVDDPGEPQSSQLDRHPELGADDVDGPRVLQGEVVADQARRVLDELLPLACAQPQLRVLVPLEDLGNSSRQLVQRGLFRASPGILLPHQQLQGTMNQRPLRRLNRRRLR